MNFTKIIDISWPISPSMTHYKNNKHVNFSALKEYTKDKARESLINLTTHTGTHVDAPAHFLEYGQTIDTCNLSSLIAPALLIDCTEYQDTLTASILESLLVNQVIKDKIVLLKTKNSHLSPIENFNPEFIFLDQSAAEFLVSQKIKAVGIDYIGIERAQPGHPTHKLLLSNNILIVEGLRLAHINPGTYFFICLPLLLVNLDGAPARAILLENC